MSLTDWLGLSKAVSQPIKAVSDLYTTDKARINAEAKLTEAQTKFEEIAQKPMLAQISLNSLLANSGNIFKSGYIPLIGWTCGFLILVYYLPQIFIATYVWGRLCIDTGIVKPYPIKPDDLMNLVYLIITSKIHSIVSK